MTYTAAAQLMKQKKETVIRYVYSNDEQHNIQTGSQSTDKWPC